MSAKNNVTLDNSKKREDNRMNRARQSGQMDNNDMMSAKSMFVFFMSLFEKNSSIKKQLLDENQLLFIQKIKDKLAISDEAAIDMIKNDKDFEKLNKKSFNLDEKEKDEICKWIKLGEVKDLSEENILKVKEKAEELQKQRDVETMQKRVDSAVENKIHRNLNRNRNN